MIKFKERKKKVKSQESNDKQPDDRSSKRGENTHLKDLPCNCNKNLNQTQKPNPQNTQLQIHNGRFQEHMMI